MEIVHALAYSVVFVFVLTVCGNAACRWMFRLTGLQTGQDGAMAEAPRAGRVIGSLERLVLSLGILTQSWEVLAAVIALKTVARFKELDDKNFAEYFLAGSLFSILWAAGVTTAWSAYDHHFGPGLLGYVSDMLDAAAPAPALTGTNVTP